MRVLNDLCSEIQGRALSNGSWAYDDAEDAAVEPTCLALLALNSLRSAKGHPGVRTLLSAQNSDGSWPAFIPGDREAFWVTALVVLTLNHLGTSRKAVDKAVQWIVTTIGREGHWFWKWKYRMADRRVRFDPDKYGWPWMPGTVSWVIPTAFSLIALKQSLGCCSTPEAMLRIVLGTEMLMDRRCIAGGWNAGNSVVDGASLSPHIDTTAIALLALDDDRSLNWLRKVAPTCNSVYSLAWSVLALLHRGKGSLECGICIERVQQKLQTGYIRLNIETLALAALALEVFSDSKHPFDSR